MLTQNRFFFALAMFSQLALPVPAFGDTPAAPVTSFGVAFKPFDAKLSKNRRTVRITKPFPQDDPRYYRLRVRVDNPRREDWTISVRSPVGQILSTFDQSETGCEDAAGCWTARLSSKLPTVQFATDSDLVKAEIVGALYMPAEAKHPFYSPMAGSVDERLSAMTSGSADEKQAIYELADTLGLFIGSGNAPDGSLANWCCSGVRLTGDLFMTNWHCGATTGMAAAAFWPTTGSGNVCRAGIVDLSWDEDEIGREFACEKVEYVNKDLDVAILRLGKLADGLGLSRPLRLPVVSTNELSAGDEVKILHHPACKPKSVTRGCTVLKPGIRSWTGTDANAPLTDFTHNCTTEAGSSGGPVFSADNRLIGLHHLGADSARPDPGNFAVGMASILEKLRTDAAGLHREITGSEP